MRMRYGSGVRKDDLLERARKLRESVDPLLPRLGPECPTDRFDRMREDLEKVREARDDESHLERMSHWGDPLPRAYAGLLKFSHDPQMPTVVAFPVPAGEQVSFAPLSRATREAEVAVQHFEDPERLLLAYQDWARKGFHFFAGPTRLWCMGRSPEPPADFRTAKLAALPYRFIADAPSGRYDCAHLNAGEPRPYLEVGWPGAHATFRLCRRCAKGERQLFATLTQGIVTPDLEGEFPVGAALNVTCHGGEACVHADLPALSRNARRAYEAGRLSDAQLIAAYLSEIRPRIEATRSPTFVAGGVCYGSDREAFLGALHATPIERHAIDEALGASSGLFEIEEATASKALEHLWAEHADTIVHSIVSDPKEAQKYLQEGQRAPGRIAELLKRAQRRSEEREVLGALPRYSRLTREAAYVDSVARAFRSQGVPSAERAAVQSLSHEGKERGLAYGILLALGRAAAHSWQFSNTEKEFGASLEAQARDVLYASPEDYHAALDHLFSTAGVAHWGEREAA
jgi:hypothetical protein